MRVFISSVIGGFEEYRSAAADAVSSLGLEVVRAEDFGASPATPQQACLAEVRASDVMVLLLGERYGPVQPSGRSATHEEYHEARDEMQVLAFVQSGVDRDSDMDGFVEEVQRWEGGGLTSPFSDPEDLRHAVTRRLHEFIVASESAYLDGDDIIERSRTLFGGAHRSGSPSLAVVVACGPSRTVLRPAELDDPEMKSDLTAMILTGPDAVFSPAEGTSHRIHGTELRFEQGNGARLVAIDELGSLKIVQPALADRTGMMPSIIEEDVADKVVRALNLAAGILDRVDPIRRLTHVAPIVTIRGASHVAWRTRAEQHQSPNSYTLSTLDRSDQMVELSPPVRRRQQIEYEAESLVEDFVARLRRIFHS